jgi:serine protease Do
MHQIFRKVAAPAALALGLGVTATAMNAVQDPIPDLSAQAAQAAVAGPETLASAFRSASRAALPGVVHVQVEAAPRAVSRQMPDLRGTPFEDFFGGPRGPQGQPRPQMGSGSGFIISPDGYILTNNHVVEKATRVTVKLTDKREFKAEVVGRDPNTDVAVLKIEGRNLPTVRLGSAEAHEVGDWVLALGFPMSLDATVTAGIISAKGRSIQIMERNEEAQAPLEHFIQTDAAINPGNSGGPLVNLRGEVIGINTAIASPTGAYSGYGFAVPVELAKRVADDLIRHGVVHRPKLGVQIRDVSLADVEVFRLPSADGAAVVGQPEGPASEAGLRLGDVIVAVDGKKVDDTSDLMQMVALRQPGERVALDIVRYGDRERVAVKLGAFQAEPAERTAARTVERDALEKLGFAAEKVTPQIAQQLKLKNPGGVVVTGVDPMGPAARAGLPRGLQIERLNGKEIRDLRDLRAGAGSLQDGGTVSIIGRLPDGSQTIINYRLHG